jgi:hypothetical protein
MENRCKVIPLMLYYQEYNSQMEESPKDINEILAV